MIIPTIYELNYCHSIKLFYSHVVYVYLEIHYTSYAFIEYKSSNGIYSKVVM